MCHFFTKEVLKKDITNEVPIHNETSNNAFILFKNVI